MSQSYTGPMPDMSSLSQTLHWELDKQTDTNIENKQANKKIDWDTVDKH